MKTEKSMNKTTDNSKSKRKGKKVRQSSKIRIKRLYSPIKCTKKVANVYVRILSIQD